MEHGPPLLRSFLSKHKDGQRPACTRTQPPPAVPARTHPAEPRQHLEELIQRADKRFPESTKETFRGASNGPPLLTQTHTHATTHAHTRRLKVKGRIRWSEGNKERLFLSFPFFFLCGSTLKVAQHLRSPPPGAGVDFHRRWSFVHTSLCVSVSRQGSSWPPGGGGERR